MPRKIKMPTRFKGDRNIVPEKVTQYNPAMCDRIIQVAMEGGKMAAMCLAIGCYSRQTFYNWVHDNPDFAEAYEFCKLIDQARLEDKLEDIIDGNASKDGFNSIAIQLNNRFKEDYSRGTNGSGGSSGNNISVTFNQQVNNLSGPEIDQQIKELLSGTGLKSVAHVIDATFEDTGKLLSDESIVSGEEEAS